MDKAPSILRLRCTVSSGQFESEVAISGNEYNGDEFSLFVDRRFVECDDFGSDDTVEARLQVVELAREGDLVLVRLPGRTLSNGQSITVRASALDCEAHQEA